MARIREEEELRRGLRGDVTGELRSEGSEKDLAFLLIVCGEEPGKCGSFWGGGETQLDTKRAEGACEVFIWPQECDKKSQHGSCGL